MKTTVVHHSADFDGLFCREIARKFIPDAELIGWDYGDPTPKIQRWPDKIAGVQIEQTQLYMLDISVDGLMDYPGLIWIDHHKSAIEKFGNNIPGYRIDGVAACRLAWQWFKGNHTDPTVHPSDYVLPTKEQFVNREIQEPLAVRLAGEYDIWDKRDPNAELFQHGLRSCDLTERLEGKTRWERMLGDDALDAKICVNTLLKNGEALQYARTAENASIIKAAGFTIQFEGLTFLCCNHARYNSFLFTAGLKPEHDACFGFAWRDGKWTVSLYHAPGKEHHDLSKIAVKYGGGGHRGACGFQTKTLPFLA